MDALGDALAPYSDDIAKFAGTVTCLQFLSGIVLMNDIRKKGCSDAYPSEPFLGGVVLTALSVKLGALMGDQAMIKVNLFGFVVNVVFVLVFYWYASNQCKTKIWLRIGVAALFTMTCLAYSNFEDPAKVEVRFGLVITGILIFLVGSPLLNLGDIIANKSTEGLPFPIILAGTIVCGSWTLYGISIKNEFMTYQNLLLLVMSAFQLSLFVIYPSGGSSKAVKKQQSKDQSKSTETKKTN